jgi:hypothetical protein
MPNRPPAAFSEGQRVRVVRSGRLGTVRCALWHFQAERYDYYLEGEDGRRDPTAYREVDLRPAR